jgi:glucose/arabinose dehydrogenase
MQPHIRMGKSVYLFVTIALALLASIGTLLSLLIGAAKGAANLPQGFTDSPPVVSGLSNPTDMEFAPDGKLFVLEQAGRVRFVRSDGTLGTFLNISTKVDATGERGLLGIAFDPAFATNRYVYLHYTRKATSTVPVHNRVVRVRANATNTAIVSGSEKLVFRLNNLSSATNHNGGDIHFSPANKLLYIATGDNAQPSNAQSLNNLKGKILRINKNGTIPTSNPFYTAANNTQGLKFTFNKIGSLLFVNDVGANAWEEINEVSGGGNYGWPLYEGQENDPKYANPVYAYGHDGDVATTGCAITGGAFYDPQVKMFPPEYHDQYFFADFCSGWIRHFRGTDFTVSYPFASDLGRAVDIQAKDSTGELYYLVRGAPGTVNKISYSVTTPP